MLPERILQMRFHSWFYPNQEQVAA